MLNIEKLLMAFFVCLAAKFVIFIACLAPLSMGFPKQEYWSELPCLPPGDLPDPRIESTSLMFPDWQVGSLPLVPPVKPQLLYTHY